MPTITINIASPGTLLADGSTMIGGHMWFELDDGQGSATSMTSFGWIPQPDSRHGQVTNNDSNNYQRKSYSRTIRISPLQYRNMIAFARDPRSHGADSIYDLTRNNSIDYTWRTLRQGGLRPDDFGAAVWPGLNYHDVPDTDNTQSNHWRAATDFVPELLRESTALLNASWKAMLLDDLYQAHRDSWDACWPRYAQLRSTVPRNDLLLLDLDDDGLQTRGIFRGVYFDHNNDGIKTISAWARPNDGMLVLERNGNGVIDNGTELFGRHTPHAADAIATSGLRALAALDGNRDGVVNQHDRNWHLLKVWRDLNQDGISQVAELFTLTQFKIAGLHIAGTNQRKILGNGNVIAGRGQYRKTDGSSGNMAMVEFREAPFFRQFKQPLNADDANAHLPDAPGSGKVHDLRAACSQSTALRATVIRYAAATSRQAQRALLPQLLSDWAATAGLSSSLQQRAGARYRVVWNTPGEWEQTLRILDAFNGQHFFEIHNGIAVAAHGVTVIEGNDEQPGTISISLSRHQQHALQQDYQHLQESLYGILLLQTRFKSLFDRVQGSVRHGVMQMNFNSLQDYFNRRIVADRNAGLAELMEFFRYASTSSATPQWRADLVLARQLHQLHQLRDSNDALKILQRQLPPMQSDQYQSNRILLGTDGADQTFGHQYNDLLCGGPGDDGLFGDDGNDLLDGGSGDDTLSGDDGDDIYLLRRHSGHDVIDNRAAWRYADSRRVPRQRGSDIVVFDDVASGDRLTINNRGGDMQLEYGARDSVTIKQGLVHRHHEVSAFHFSDGAVMSTARLIKARGIEPVQLGAAHDVMRLSRHNDILYAGAGDDSINGGHGNDTLYGEHGDDLLFGGHGADVLSGGAGADVLIGGHGNDLIIAASGADVIAFNRGDGADSVRVSSNASGSVVSLGGGIRYSDLLFRKSGNELIFNLGASDSLTFRNWYAAREHQGIGTLQVVLHGDYNPAALSALNTKQIAHFDFSALVARFDTDRSTNPRLQGWALSSALPHYYLDDHDSAIGGERVYRYGRNRDFLLPSIATTEIPGSSTSSVNSAGLMA